MKNEEGVALAYLHPGLKLKGPAGHLQHEATVVGQAATIVRAKGVARGVQMACCRVKGRTLEPGPLGLNTRPMALLLCDPESLPNHTYLGFPICKRWMINRVLTTWGCCEKEVSFEMAPGTPPVPAGVLATTIQLGVMGEKEEVSVHSTVCRGTELACGGGDGWHWQAVQGQSWEKACGLNIGSCGAEVLFEGVFHGDLSDKPDWTGECLQQETWRRLCSSPGLVVSTAGENTRKGKAVGRPELVLPSLEPPGV